MATKESWPGPLEKIGPWRWRIPKSYKPCMNVDGLIFANESLMEAIRQDRAPEQVANVACLPGIVSYSLAMPDIHWGYGFPIGGVAATDPKKGGVVSPGGVGYDINCGVRLVHTNLREEDVKPRIRDLVASLFVTIPTGVGRGGRIRFTVAEERKIMSEGVPYLVKRGYGTEADSLHTEARGAIEGADPDRVSSRAYERGRDQCGTLGSGNHFVEVQVVDEVYDDKLARAFGLEKGQVTVMIHSGSRGLGYQVCDDYLHDLSRTPAKYGIELPDRQLVCAPVGSEEGQNYLAAMRAAANYAWGNRQILMYLARQVFEKFFAKSWEELGMSLIYDVAHNIAKMEEHTVNGKKMTLCIHRKGATRAFPPGHAEIPEDYRSIGQPVLIPGDMGRNSYLLVGQKEAMDISFGTTCHGAGRVMSRGAAIRAAMGRNIQKELEAKGIIAMARDRKGLDEEQPAAYKDVNEVVEVVHEVGISKKVLRMRPIGVIKG